MLRLTAMPDPNGVPQAALAGPLALACLIQDLAHRRGWGGRSEAPGGHGAVRAAVMPSGAVIRRAERGR